MQLDLRWAKQRQVAGESLTRSQVFTDLLLADFLVTYTPWVNKVVFQ